MSKRGKVGVLTDALQDYIEECFGLDRRAQIDRVLLNQVMERILQFHRDLMIEEDKEYARKTPHNAG